MQSEIIYAQNQEEFYIDEGCFIRELLKTEDHSLSFAQARLLPGQSTKNHVLSVDEYYYILRGTGSMFINNILKGELEAGDLVRIKSSDAQYILNTSSADLIFLCVCNPAFETRHFQALD